MSRIFISSFTIARNTDKLYFPLKASITSVLPIVDEMVVVLGEGDADDTTEDTILSIGSPKISVIHRKWDEALFHGGEIFAHETTFALNQCMGQWCIYLQADEVLHENDLDKIAQACRKYDADKEVDGFLLKYLHFWADYLHLVETHGLISREIRVVRNGIGCYSYKDAVSFRKGNNEKLQVVEIPVTVYHYGYVRPPKLMTSKKKIQDDIHKGLVTKNPDTELSSYSWGPMGGLKIFEGTHPAVMKEWLEKFNWSEALDFSKPALFESSRHKHLRFKYRALTWIERTFNGGEELFGFKNYILLKK